MTRIRLTALIACLVFATSGLAQFHESPDPGSGSGGGCRNWLCAYVYGTTQCWPQGEPTGIRSLKCLVVCDSGECWCAYENHCYSI